MIELKDLRIGNYYLHSQSGIIQLNGEWISYFAKFPELLSGIPLTEDILLKAGFETLDSYYQDGYEKPFVLFDKKDYKRSGFALEFRYGYEPEDNCFVMVYLAYQEDASNLSYAYSDEFTNQECREVELKYLHQLQNLYYALTGTELSTNLNQ